MRACLPTIARPRRLLSTLAFQGRVGIIVRTLYHVVPPLAHLVVVLVVMCVAFSFMAHVVLGPYYGPMASLGGAIYDTFGIFSGYSAIRAVSDIIPPEVEMMVVQKVAASLVLVAQIVLVVMLLINFFFAILGGTFMKLKYSRSFMYGSTLWQDLSRTILPDAWAGAQRWSRKVACGLMYRTRKPPLTNRQAARAVRNHALEGVDVRPLQRTVIKVRLQWVAAWLGRARGWVHLCESPEQGILCACIPVIQSTC